MVKQTVDKFGRVDILVNTAGGILSFKKMEELSFEDWNADIAFNLTGTFLCCVAAGKVMIEQKHGKIINISSTAGIVASPTWAHYGAAKAGVINLTKSLAAGNDSLHRVAFIMPSQLLVLARSYIFTKRAQHAQRQHHATFHHFVLVVHTGQL